MKLIYNFLSYGQCQINYRNPGSWLIKKDDRAFYHLYECYAGTLYGIILDTIPDKIKTSEILTKVFEEIGNQISYYDPSKCRLFTWMYNITTRYIRQ